MSRDDYEGNFYIGREYDLSSGKLKSEPTLYDPDDLTTHGVVVGMTGSGKTGLCIDILEEAALNGIPAIMIDPKGDIARLLDGLESAAGKKGEFKRKEADKAIANLKKRVFLLHNVHASEPQIFHTRWAMAYLKGPITRVQLKALNLLAGIGPRTQSEIAPLTKQSSAELDDSGTTLTRQTVSAGIGEYFLPNNLTVAESLKRMQRDSSGAKTLG